jgi:Family of unknown function (DUF6412)
MVQRDGAVMLARWPRAALSALALAMVAWAAPVMAFLLTDNLPAAAGSPQRLAALAVAVLAVALVGCLAAGASFVRTLAGVPLASRATAFRDKSFSVAFLRQRDPDAAGRPRPRAPGSAPAAA